MSVRLCSNVAPLRVQYRVRIDPPFHSAYMRPFVVSLAKSMRVLLATPLALNESLFQLLSSPSLHCPSDFSPIVSMTVHVCSLRPCVSQLGRNKSSDARILKLEMRTKCSRTNAINLYRDREQREMSMHTRMFVS